MCLLPMKLRLPRINQNCDYYLRHYPVGSDFFIVWGGRRRDRTFDLVIISDALYH